MGLTVNQKGLIGLVKVTADLVDRGYEVFTPISGASPVDIVAGNSTMILKRLQVKYREPERAKGVQALVVSLDSIVNGKRKPVDLNKIDGWAIYCPQTDQVYYVHKSNVVGRGIRICLNDFKGRKNRLACEFRDPSRLW